jgi:murein DD-endopeptidase MepM/ murein hydrolase activator NlpD
MQKIKIMLGAFAILIVSLSFYFFSIGILSFENGLNVLYKTNIFGVFQNDGSGFETQEQNPIVNEAQEFTGLIYPLEQVPNWLKIPKEKWSGNIKDIDSELLIDLPEYDAELLAIDKKSLNLAEKKDQEIANLQLTYIVPYMGNYKLDGKEYAGSHLAVDIRTPEGNSVLAIGDGLVTKVSEDEFGFGKHILILHEDFPSFEDADKQTQYISSYSHLSESLVSEGDLVSKGQKIGLSGNTGSSSLPHLHFQIDKISAPWHPFWPFSANELRLTDMSFIEAINTGFNNERAMLHTIHPMEYIKKYLETDVNENQAAANIDINMEKQEKNDQDLTQEKSRELILKIIKSFSEAL